MLFYFLMKTGNLCSLNVDPLTIEVAQLKSLLSNEIKVNEQSIILIANGGLCIQDGILRNYNCADNKENPVFVYLREQKRTVNNLNDNNDLISEYIKLMEKLRIIISKSGNSFSALQENEALSSQILQSSKRFQSKIEIDIRNQFFLVEGWSAALANLYDSLSSLEKRIDAMKSNLEKFLYNSLEDGHEIMEKFTTSKAVLENVPLFSALCDDCKVQGEEHQQPVNLHQWVLSQDNRTRPQVTVQSLILDAHQAYKELLGISDDGDSSVEYLKNNWGKTGLIGKAYENIEIGKSLISEGKPMQSIIDEDIEEVEKVVEKSSHTSTKDFLKRLNYLNGFHGHCEKLVNLIQTHKEYMEQTVKQCRDNVGQIILLDHCASAKTHLDNVIKYYTNLKETFEKIERSKQDLANNIDIRKIWLQKFQTRICEVDDSIFVVKEKIKRLRAGLRVLDQLQSAPLIYVKGVAEIARRQHILDFWYSWGMQNSKFAQEIRTKDHEARMLWEQDIATHFIQSLFSSLYSFSLPKLGYPLLQSSRPILPSISENELNQLSEQLPEFQSFLKIDKIDPNSIMVNSVYSEQIIEDEPLSKSVPSDNLYNGVSLLPVPDDLLIPPIHELCLSQQKQVSNESLSNSSSKLVKSINSSDYQLPDDGVLENKMDCVCIPRSTLEFLVHNLNESKRVINETKSDILKHRTEQVQSTKEIQKLVKDVINTSEIVILNSQINSAIKDNSTNCMTKSSSTSTQDIKTPSNSFHIAHKEFSNGDLVCFFGHMVNGVMQWRMISTDDKIYFLCDNNLKNSPTMKRQRRESTVVHCVSDFHQTDSSTMSQSQLTPQPSQVDFIPYTMPIIKGTYLSKEEYVCKKPTNRYGLPTNTRFFRVKANIDWSSGRPANN